MTKKEIVNRIIDFFVNRNLPEKASLIFGRWLVDKDGWEEKDAAMLENWKRFESKDSSLPQWEIDRFKSEISGIIEPRQGNGKGLFLRWPVVAAVVSLFVCLSAWGIYSVFRAEDQMRICLVSGENSKGNFTLPDGSQVWLNSNSRLIYGNDFLSAAERRVSVDGEAFFNVKKGKKPFVVSLSGVDVKVVGTRFNVRNSEFFAEEEVSLQSGTVVVSSGAHKSLTLSPGESYVFNPIKNTYRVEHVETDAVGDWTGSSLVFKDERLVDIIKSLEHWYHAKITASAEIDMSMRLSFTLTPEPIDETMKLLSVLTGYDFRLISKNSILINK